MKAIHVCQGLLLWVAALLPVAPWAQNTVPPQKAVPQPSDVIDCNTFAAQDGRLALISKLCTFALTYRSKLPDFIAQQTTTSHGARSTIVIKSQVTYRQGLEQYSQITVNGKALPPDTPLPTNVHLITSGEFGPLLINLFEVPDSTEFKFVKTDALDSSPVSVFDFHLPKDKNSFWAIRAPRGETLKPEFRGRLWLDSETGRIVREEVEPVVNENTTWIHSVKLDADYAMTRVGDLGTFLLPTKSESKMCLGGPQYLVSCTTNVVVFHDYRKFIATSRILPAGSQP